jgi:hypothetical protein
MSKIYSLEDLLAQEHTPAVEFGLDNIVAAIQARLAFLNDEVANQMNWLAETSADTRRVWGTSETFEMKEVDEYGFARTQQPTSGVEVGFPLRKFSVSTGWTRDYLLRATARDLAKKALGIMGSYQIRLRKEIQYAVFNNDNYTFTDFLGDGTDLAVKAFLNADSALIPDAPSGTTFDGTSHQHYVGTSGASLAYTDIDTLIANVVEHGNMRDVSLIINEADVSVLVGLTTTKFVAVRPAVLVMPTTAATTVLTTDANQDPANALVGYWGAYPVYTRSWVVDNYIVCAAVSAAEKPLLHRVDRVASIRGLRMVYEFDANPITAQSWEAYEGFAPWNRAAVAVLDTAHQTTYTEPTIIANRA